MKRLHNMKTENMLEEYYIKERMLDRLNWEYEKLKIRIDEIKSDLKNCNFELENTLKAMQYSDDIKGTKGHTSPIEQSLMNAFDKLEKELTDNIEDKYHLRERIRQMSSYLDNMNQLLQVLNQDDLEILRLKYGRALSYQLIGDQLLVDKSTAKRKHDLAIKRLSEEIRLLN